MQEWRLTQPKGGRAAGDGKKKQRRDASIAAAVASQVEAQLSSIKSNKDEQAPTSKAAIKAFLVSAFDDDGDKKPTAGKATTIGSTDVGTHSDVQINNVTLASILKAAKNTTK